MRYQSFYALWLLAASAISHAAISKEDLPVKRSFDRLTADMFGNIIPSSSGSGSIRDQRDQAEEPTKEEPKRSNPCSAIHPLTNGFYDLSDLSSINKDSIVAMAVKGYDYNRNFTLGVCSSPLKPNIDVNNNNPLSSYRVNSSEVGGYYIDDAGEKFSIGNFNLTPVFRGKKLTLTYSNGSYCPNGVDKKSTILSFACDREILSKAIISFVGVLHDCDYFFEVRTVHACPTAQKSDNLAVIWIFLFILLAALFVYCSGGFLYKRIVLNRRGWSQLPSYGLGSKVSSAFSGNWSRRSSRAGAVSLHSDRFGFVDDQNELLDSLDTDN